MSNERITIGEYSYKLTVNANEYTSKMNMSKQQMQSFDKQMNSTISMMKTGLTAALITGGIAVADFCNTSVNEFATFEKKMNEVFTLLPSLSQSAMDNMTQQAKEFSQKYGVEIGQVTNSMYQGISASVPQENIFSFLDTAVKASKGGVTELDTAVDGLTSVVNAYGDDVISVEEASDKMFTTVKLGKTTFGELASDLSDIIPLASASGITFTDVSAAIATMTAQGVKTSQSTTQLKQMFAELTDAGSEIGKTFKSISGVDFVDFIAQGNNTQQALQLLNDYANTSGVQINQLFSSIEAGQASLALSGKNTERFIESITAMNNSAGATDTAFKRMENGITDSMDKVTAKINNQLLDAGEKLEPIMLSGLNAVSGGLDIMNGLLSNTAVQTAGVTATAVMLYKALHSLSKTELISGFISSFKLSMAGVKSALIMAQEAQLGVSGIVKATTTAIKEQALAWLSTPTGAIVAITTAIAGVALAYNSYRENIRKTAEESRQAHEQTLTEIESLKSELDGIKEKLSEINADGKIDLTEEDSYNRLKATNDELERELRIKEELEKLQGKKAETDTINEYNASSMRGHWFSGEYGNGLYNIAYETETDRMNNHLTQVQKYYNELENLNSEYDSGIIDADKYTSETEIINDKLREHEGYLTDSVNALQKYRESLIGATPEGEQLATEIDTALTAFDEFYAGINDPNVSGYTSNTEEAKEETEEAKDSVEELKNRLDKLKSSYTNINNAIEEYNEKGYLSIDTLSSIANSGYQYLQYLSLENGQLKLNTAGYNLLINSQLDEIETQQILQATKDLQALTDEASATEYLANATGLLASNQLDLAQATYELYYAKNIEKGGKIAEATKAIGENLSTFKSLLNDSRNSLSSVTADNEAFVKSLEDEIDALEIEKSALENRKSALQNTKADLEQAKNSVKELVDLVENMLINEKELEKEAIQEQKDNLNELINKRQELLEIEKDEIEANKTLAEKQNTVAQNALAYSIAQLDDSGAGKKAQKQSKDSLTDSKNDLREYLIDRQYDIRSDNLDDIKESENAYYDKQIEVIDEYLDDERKLYEDACAMIDNDNGELYGKLKQYVYSYTTTSEAEFNRLWSNAQTAISEYSGSNLNLMGLIDLLEVRIYNTEDAIDIVSNSIDTMSGRISNANDTLSKYKDTLSEIVEKTNQLPSSNGWRYTWNGKTYVTEVQDKESAAMSLSSQISKSVGQYVPYASLLAHMEKYADGTLSAKGGLSLVGEHGAELRILNKGDGILPNDITSTLLSFAQNPAGFISRFSNNKSSEVLTNNIAPTIQINVQGDATQSTVQALRAEADNIVKRATTNVMNIALRNKRLI